MKEKLDIIQKLTLMDDIFFEAFAQDQEAVQEMLRVILEKPNLIVKEVRTQDAFSNLYGKSVRLDACCKLEDGKIVNVEIQNSDNDNHIKRALYNAAHVVIRESDKGTKFEELPNIIVIYIMKSDFFKKDKLVYHMDFAIRDMNEILDSGIEVMYLNASKIENSAISRLLQNMKKTVLDDPEFPKLTQRFKYLKNEEKGVQRMCELMEKYTKNVRIEGELIGKIKIYYFEMHLEPIEIARRLNVSENVVLDIIHNSQENN